MFVSHMDQIATNMESVNNNTVIILYFVYQFPRINTPQLHNGLTLNRGKTALLLSLAPFKSVKIPFQCLHHNVCNTSVRLSKKVKLHCFILDRHATLYRHILQMHRSTCFQTRELGHIRNVISNTSKSTAQVIQSLRQRYKPTLETTLATY